MFNVINLMENNKIEKKYKRFKNAINYVKKQGTSKVLLIQTILGEQNDDNYKKER